MNFEKGNMFESVPDEINEELFTGLIQQKNIRIERIISRGQTSPPSGWYDQDDNEWVLVVKGQAKLAFEDECLVHLEAGSYINIPAHTKHRVTWTDPGTETIWLAVHYK